MSDLLKIYVVEDMAISRASLELMLLKNGYGIAGSAAKAEIAWLEIQETKVDLILLDVNLAGKKDGIWLAQKVRENLHIPIVYLTAYGDKETLKSVLQTKPNGYLMKPYNEQTVVTTLRIAIENFHNEQEEINYKVKKVLFIKRKNIQIKISIDDINYIKSEGNYLEIEVGQKTHVVRSKLSEFINLLPEHIFVKVHQRYIINLDKIDSFSSSFVIINNNRIPISKKYQSILNKKI